MLPPPIIFFRFDYFPLCRYDYFRLMLTPDDEELSPDYVTLIRRHFAALRHAASRYYAVDYATRMLPHAAPPLAMLHYDIIYA